MKIRTSIATAGTAVILGCTGGWRFPLWPARALPRTRGKVTGGTGALTGATGTITANANRHP